MSSQIPVSDQLRDKRKRDFHLILESLLRLRKIKDPSNAARYYLATQYMERLSFIAGENVANTELKALELPMLLEASTPLAESK